MNLLRVVIQRELSYNLMKVPPSVRVDNYLMLLVVIRESNRVALRTAVDIRRKDCISWDRVPPTTFTPWRY